MNGLAVHCIVESGDNDLDRLARTGLPSLLQEGNLPAIARGFGGVDWCFYVHDSHRDSLSALIEKFELDSVGTVNINDQNFEHDRIIKHVGTFGAAATMHQARFCLERDRFMLNAPPSMVFADGSIQSGMALAVSHQASLVATHLTVLETAFNEALLPTDWPLDSAELTERALRALHPVWLSSNSALECNNSFYTGHEITYVSESLYSVRQRVPQMHIVKIDESDIPYLGSVPDNRLWHWLWPGKKHAEGRLRIVGSGDTFFAVELATADQYQNFNLTIKRGFVEYHAHHHANKFHLTQLRSKSDVLLVSD